MSLSRLKPLADRLVSKYGVVGAVAARYLLAGLHVRVNHPTRYGAVHVVAVGNGGRLAVEVFQEPREVPKEVVEALSSRAKLIKARPVLILYGTGPKLSEEVRKLCSELGVSVRRIRP